MNIRDIIAVLVIASVVALWMRHEAATAPPRVGWGEATLMKRNCAIEGMEMASETDAEGHLTRVWCA